MASANIKTANLEFDGVKLRVFDKIGFNSGKNWVINAFAGCFVEVDPSPISPQIIGLINADINAGNLEKIDHLTLKSSNLLSLYLEGMLPVSSIVHTEDKGSWVIFKDVQFNMSSGVVSFPIWVSDIYQIATIDKNGDIV